MSAALSRFSQQSKCEIPNFSLPRFEENFSEKEGITNKKLKVLLEEQIKIFLKQIN